MQTERLWTTDRHTGSPMLFDIPPAPRARPQRGAPLRTPRGGEMRFDLTQTGPRSWGWSLRDAFGDEFARSHVSYPSKVQASAAAVAFATLVKEAGKQVRDR